MDLDLLYKIDDEWEWYIGEIFFRLIKANMNKCNTVVEFAPGFRYKSAYALKALNFKGKFYVVDANSLVIEYVCKKYKEILSDAEIIGINKTLNDAVSLLPHETDLFLANHCIDDMIMYEYLNNDERSLVFDNNDISKELLLKKWEALSLDKLRLENIKSKVLNEWISFFNSVKFNLIVMSQYNNNMYFLDVGNNYSDVLTRDLFLRLKSCFITDDNISGTVLDFCAKEDDNRFKDINLLRNTQNASNWIVGKYSKLR